MDPGRRVAHVAPEHGLERGRQGRALEEVGAVGLDGVDARGEGVDPVGDGEVDRLGAQLLGSLDEPGRARVRETARLDGVVVVLTPGGRGAGRPLAHGREVIGTELAIGKVARTPCSETSRSRAASSASSSGWASSPRTNAGQGVVRTRSAGS